MTENKRFTYMEQFNGFCDVFDYGKVLTCMRLEYVEKTVGLLNNFQELSINDLKHIEQLQKENEQLKNIIQILKDIIYNNESGLIYEYSSDVYRDMEQLEKAYNSEDISELIKFCNG